LRVCGIYAVELTRVPVGWEAFGVVGILHGLERRLLGLLRHPASAAE
jgi:hypothetical protein